MKGWRRWAVPALVALVALAGCGGGGGGGGADSRRLSIATGGTGGVYLVYGGGLAKLITSSLEGYEATAEVTSASVDNMTLIGDEKTAVAFTLADTASDAVQGRGSFKEQVPAQALARLYTNYTQVVATAGKGIDRIEDLKGKRVSVGSPNSGTEVIALRILEAAGLNPDDLRRQQLGVAESVQAVMDGSLDAFFWSGGLPTGAVTDLATSRKIVLLPTDEYVQPLRSQYGEVYAETTIPGGTYKGVTDGVKVIGVPNYLVVNRSMSEDLAYQLTKLLFEQQPELVKVHPEAKNLDLKTAQQVTPLELHPGAQRYYQETAG
ncbi:MAG TPA: TAXI family TRAP transporter solute-binding subunit [Propionibacteriaceae bacterium]|nr:TAXI family TRAP transporter solute-binding subunit [Propionibacteriaceae bacterium]